MTTKRFDIAFMIAGVLALGSLSACSMEMYHPTYISPNKIQVEDNQSFEQIPLNELDSAKLDAVAMNYDRRGHGPFDLTVTYDPASRTNTAMHAERAASSIATILHRNGIEDMTVSTMPVNAQGDVSTVLMTYDSYEALPPKDCTVMAGMDSTHAEPDPKYQLGCSVDTIMANQIARPKDLARPAAEKPTTDGRRASKIIEIYRAGSKDQKLDGESASGK